MTIAEGMQNHDLWTHDLSQIIEQIPIGVAVTLPSVPIEYVNPHLSAMLRSPPAQLEGVDLAD